MLGRRTLAPLIATAVVAFVVVPAPEPAGAVVTDANSVVMSSPRAVNGGVLTAETVAEVGPAALFAQLVPGVAEASALVTFGVATPANEMTHVVMMIEHPDGTGVAVRSDSTSATAKPFTGGPVELVAELGANDWRLPGVVVKPVVNPSDRGFVLSLSLQLDDGSAVLTPDSSVRFGAVTLDAAGNGRAQFSNVHLARDMMGLNPDRLAFPARGMPSGVNGMGYESCDFIGVAPRYAGEFGGIRIAGAVGLEFVEPPVNSLVQAFGFAYREPPPDVQSFTSLSTAAAPGVAPWQRQTPTGIESAGDIRYSVNGRTLRFDFADIPAEALPDDMMLGFSVADLNNCLVISIAGPIGGVAEVDEDQVFPPLRPAGDPPEATTTTEADDDTSNGGAQEPGDTANDPSSDDNSGSSALPLILVALLVALALATAFWWLRRRQVGVGVTSAGPPCVDLYQAWQAELQRVRASEARVAEFERLIEREAQAPAASEAQRTDWAEALERSNETLERDRRKAAEAETAYRRCLGEQPTASTPSTKPSGPSRPAGPTTPASPSGGGGAATTPGPRTPPVGATPSQPVAPVVPISSGPTPAAGPPCAPGTTRNTTVALRTFHDVLVGDRPIRVTVQSVDRAAAAEPALFSIAEFHAYHHDPATGVGAGDTRFTFVVEFHVADRTVRCERDDEWVDGEWVPGPLRRQVADANAHWEVVFHGADPEEAPRGEVGRAIRRLYERAKPLATPYEQRTFEAASLCPEE